MDYIDQIFVYNKKDNDFSILITDIEQPRLGEMVKVITEVEVNGFLFYRLQMIDREDYQYFDIAKALLGYYISQGVFGEATEPEEDHTGMVWNPILKEWRWL